MSFHPKQSSVDPDTPSRFVVGIDLGTTNCAVGFIDTYESEARVRTFSVAQWIDVGQVETRETLPSFHYERLSSECTGATLPWQKSDATVASCVGVMARDSGQRRPGRRIASAKSWLSHDGVDRTADFLPWHADADVPRMSPVDASSRYLAHLRSAWDHTHPDNPLDHQDVMITLPASFDEVARELTVAAAKAAGLRRIYLIEEPQAAFYAWIDRHRDDWTERVRRGQLILVCDIGGGTTDLTLIRVQSAGDAGDQVQFHRVAVGRHLILGGDNMDLAVARMAETKILSDGLAKELSVNQWDRLIAASRAVKEVMLGENRPATHTIHLPGEGASLLAGSIQVELSAEEIDAVLLDGFYPWAELGDRPKTAQSGFQEFGLPYAADPAVTRHLAEFMTLHRRSGLDQDDQNGADRPDLVLFNGGVMSAPAIRRRIVESLSRWFAGAQSDWTPQILSSPRLDLAVAHGAAYYAMVRRGEGVRIAANLGRSYYIQVGDHPPTAICLIPGHAEAGQVFRADTHRLDLQVGAPVQFPLWVSSVRLADQVGELVPVDTNQMSPLPPICTALVRGRRRHETQLSVLVESELSEIGTVGMYCVDVDHGNRWKLNFDIRSTLETDRLAHQGGGEMAGIIDSATLADCAACIASTFGEQASIKPGHVIKQLQGITQLGRGVWPPSLLRELWQFLIDVEPGRHRSPAHEARWVNLVGFCLRPGYGVAVDDWRVHQTWRRLHGKLAFASAQSRTESLILWRRIAGGLTVGQQRQLAEPLIANLRATSRKLEMHEASEILRLLASLERLEVSEKRLLARWMLDQLPSKKNVALQPALIWALGRLGSREPLYGPLNAVIPAAEIMPWVDALITSGVSTPSLPMTIAQLCRKTGDRYRDLAAEDRRRAADFLRSRSASDHLVGLLIDGGRFDGEEQAQLLGDALPLGIRVFRS